MELDPAKKAHIVRLIHFWTCEGPVPDPEKVLQQIALDANVTRDDVWNVYCEMIDAMVR